MIDLACNLFILVVALIIAIPTVFCVVMPFGSWLRKKSLER